jgi:MFS family permease
VQVFKAFEVPEYKRFWFAQFASLIGGWLQASALSWIVVAVLFPDDKATATFYAGLLSAIQWTPSLVLSLFAGALLDRISRRTALLTSQTVLMLVAVGLALVLYFRLESFWLITALAFAAGLANVFDMVARQSLIPTLVPRDLMPNAIALGSLAFNSSRILGGALFGVVAPLGLASIFLLNALSFLGVIYVIWGIHLENPPTKKTDLWEDVGAGLNYVWTTRAVRSPILMLLFLSLFVINFQVVTPTFARFALGLEEAGFGLLNAAFGIGAAIGAVFQASRQTTDKTVWMRWGALLLVVSLGLMSFAPNAIGASVCLAFAGAGMIFFTVSANSTVQLATPDSFRARVMSVYSLVFAGMAPPGALMSGWLMSALGPRVGLLVLAGLGLASVLAMQPSLQRLRGSFPEGLPAQKAEPDATD